MDKFNKILYKQSAPNVKENVCNLSVIVRFFSILTLLGIRCSADVIDAIQIEKY